MKGEAGENKPKLQKLLGSIPFYKKGSGDGEEAAFELKCKPVLKGEAGENKPKLQKFLGSSPFYKKGSRGMGQSPIIIKIINKIER